MGMSGAIFSAFRLSGGARAQPDEEAAVMIAVEEFGKAMLTRDGGLLDRLCAAELEYHRSDGTLQSKAEFIADATSGHSRWKSLNVDITDKAVSGSRALSRVRFIGEAETDGQLASVNIDVLLVWEKQAGAWKLRSPEVLRGPRSGTSSSQR